MEKILIFPNNEILTFINFTVASLFDQLTSKDSSPQDIIPAIWIPRLITAIVSTDPRSERHCTEVFRCSIGWCNLIRLNIALRRRRAQGGRRPLCLVPMRSYNYALLSGMRKLGNFPLTRGKTTSALFIYLIKYIFIIKVIIISVKYKTILAFLILSLAHAQFLSRTHGDNYIAGYFANNDLHLIST